MVGPKPLWMQYLEELKRKKAEAEAAKAAGVSGAAVEGSAEDGNAAASAKPESA